MYLSPKYAFSEGTKVEEPEALSWEVQDIPPTASILFHKNDNYDPP